MHCEEILLEEFEQIRAFGIYIAIAYFKKKMKDVAIE
jgi:hypothetical protein